MSPFKSSRHSSRWFYWSRSLGRRRCAWLAAALVFIAISSCAHRPNTPPQGTPPAAGAVSPGTVQPTPLQESGDYVYVEELPEPILKVEPVYPEDARRARIKGTVKVQALVLKDGSVGEVRVVKSIPGLDEAAMDCVRKWKFKPARGGGRALSVWTGVPIEFKP